MPQVSVFLASTPSGRPPVWKRLLVDDEERLHTGKSLESGPDLSADLVASPVVVCAAEGFMAAWVFKPGECCFNHCLTQIHHVVTQARLRLKY